MSDTKTEEETKHKEPAKKGLHGWKAATAVFGCGTLAAFGVFGVIVGILSTFLNVASSGISPGDSPAPIANQSVTPREEFLDDKFDLCGRTLPSIRELNLNFSASEGEYEDSSTDGGMPAEGDLVRSDDCGGTMSPSGAYTVPWEFDFSYRAIIYTPDGSRDDLASVDLEELRAQVESEMVVAESGVADMGDESHYYYGSLEDNSKSVYVMLVQQRSATYAIRLSSSDEVTSTAFTGEARKFGPQLSITLGSRIPEE
ncbi:hypothetical protein ACWGSK_10950 [Nocardiopsis sp. NPDC055551]|uniref:hypothetical protein n=1 Tax=Nocardiopsis sp. NPDC006832 TaxID=3157188 RepID=UPI0033D67444